MLLFLFYKMVVYLGTQNRVQFYLISNRGTISTISWMLITSQYCKLLLLELKIIFFRYILLYNQTFQWQEKKVMIWWLSELSLLHQIGFFNWLWRISISERKLLNHNCFGKNLCSVLVCHRQGILKGFEQYFLNYWVIFWEPPNKVFLTKFIQVVLVTWWSHRLLVVS